MMFYIESKQTDPYLNLALEQYVFDKLDRAHSYFMLWQNDNAIIVGKHQNTLAEINSAYVKENGIRVARRLSGGGAVYHDMGNLNFTFITDATASGLDFRAFCLPIKEALGTLGVDVELSGRNDMTIDGKKFSGNAQYVKEGRVMHHGTLLYDSKLKVLSEALAVSNDKIKSKGIKSVRSRVTNIRPYMSRDVTISEFWDALKRITGQKYDMRPYTLQDKDMAFIKKLRDDVYSQWEWNYGRSPAYSMVKQRRFEGCGSIEVYLDVAKEGRIRDAAFYGDYFSCGDPAALVQTLKGIRLNPDELSNALEGVDISHFFNNLKTQTFIELLTE